MTAAPQPRSIEPLPEDAFVLPAQVAEWAPHRGPRFGDAVWDFRDFVPRTARSSAIDFSRLPDQIAVRTAKEYLYSRLHRAIPGAGHTAGKSRPLKVTILIHEFHSFKAVLRALRAAGARRLADVTGEHLDTALASWQSVESAAIYVAFLRHLAAHSQFLTLDRLHTYPWPGRTAAAVTGRLGSRAENKTARIPEQISSPLLKAAVFYIQTASVDILAARREIEALEHRRDRRGVIKPGEVASMLESFFARRRAEGRGIPALPTRTASTRPGAEIVDGVVRAPNHRMISLLLGVSDSTTRVHDRAVCAAAAELGYESGGLDTPIAAWPDTGRPWRTRLDPDALWHEVYHLRTACWITIAYLSGMRDAEVRELRRDCAFTETTDDGRIRYKLRGRVFKGRKLSGDDAEWVVLDVVHDAVNVLVDLNDDPTHLFGYHKGVNIGHVLLSVMPLRLDRFRAHLNDLFSTDGQLFIPHAVPELGDDADGDDDPQAGTPWTFNTRQFRRTLAWHIAHQPFGVIAGAKQYKHAKLAMFDGYAGTSASGFAAEVAAEEAVALLDYAEELYRDWNDGGRAGGGATARIDAEFTRIRRELGELPGVIANPARLRSMLGHLTKTLHPGVLNDCFYQPAAAVCAKRARPAARPLPMLDACSTCPNARRSTVHLPRLATARDQARQLLDRPATHPPMPPLQRAALHQHLTTLTTLIAEITDSEVDANGGDA